MSVSHSQARLKKNMDDLMLRWAELKNTWRDSQAQEFEERYLQPLQAEIRKVQSILEHMDGILRSVQQDCQ